MSTQRHTYPKGKFQFRGGEEFSADYAGALEKGRTVRIRIPGSKTFSTVRAVRALYDQERLGEVSAWLVEPEL